MGRIGIVSDYIRKTLMGKKYSETVCKPGGGADVTALNYSTPGDDSPPLDGDSALLVKTQKGGVEATAGFMDPKNQQLAARGEKRTYARDESGETVATSWLKNDGTIVSFNEKATHTIKPDGTIIDKTGLLTTTKAPDGSFTAANAFGSFGLTSSGDFVVNGATISPLGAIVSPTSIAAPSVKAAGKELAGHNHNENDDAPNPSGPNN